MPELWTLQKWNTLVEKANRLCNCALLAGSGPVDLGREIIAWIDCQLSGGDIIQFFDPTFFQGGFNPSGTTVPLGVAPILWLGRDQNLNLTSIEEFQTSVDDFRTEALGQTLEFSPIGLGTVQKIAELKNWHEAGHFCSFRMTGMANDSTLTLNPEVARQAYENYFNSVLVDEEELTHDFDSYAIVTRHVNSGQIWVAFRENVGTWSGGQISIHNPNQSVIEAVDIYVCFSTFPKGNWPLGAHDSIATLLD